ncbi:PREDICTED: uncharacterized protein LOC106805495 [Priapulus caudatus]|uniref:Uncharacterized protein LOC106805495 n=1 Tax=Priapulus caudatus TaxID=37621 RepID=A0ABM1DRM5_PRICU|nr:PREDICTED: uncharacterized protein LOC106805495 [Priapulus caudatus]
MGYCSCCEPTSQALAVVYIQCPGRRPPVIRKLVKRATACMCRPCQTHISLDMMRRLMSEMNQNSKQKRSHGQYRFIADGKLSASINNKVSPSGDDVFFADVDKLLIQMNGTIDDVGVTRMMTDDVESLLEKQLKDKLMSSEANHSWIDYPRTVLPYEEWKEEIIWGFERPMFPEWIEPSMESL